MNTAYRKNLARHRARLLRCARRRRRHRARRLRQAALHLARAGRKPGAPLRPGHADRIAEAADRAPARPGLPVVPGARGLPRHPRPDRAGRPGRPARRHRAAGRRPGARSTRWCRRSWSSTIRWPWNAAASIPTRSTRTAPSRTAATKTASTSSTGPRRRSSNVDVIPPGNGILHQINLERMSPGGAGQGWRRLPRHAGRHRLAHADGRRAGRDRHRRRRAGSGERDAGPRLVDAPAGHHRRGADRQAAARHHRHRHRAGADRVPAQAKGGVVLSRILRRGRGRT